MNIPARWLVVMFCAGVSAVAAVAAWAALPYRTDPADELLSGRLTRQFESHYDRVFPVRTLGTNVWAALQFVVFSEGRPGVVVGQDGWLYTSEEFASPGGSAAEVRRHLDFVLDARRRLADRGSHLMVALVPSKARLYPEHLDGQRPSRLHQALYRSARSTLLAQDVVVPDLEAALQRCKTRTPVFLRTDTHWTPDGAACAADALVASAGYPQGARQFRTALAPAVEHRGDLLQFLPLSPYFGELLPAADLLEVASTVELQAATNLLGDADIPPLSLIGTSYSADARWNFAGALRRAGQQDVLNLAVSGQGPFAPMRAYLADPPHTPPQWVVWEIPERYLPRPVPAAPQTDRQPASAPGPQRS